MGLGHDLDAIVADVVGSCRQEEKRHTQPGDAAGMAGQDSRNEALEDQRDSRLENGDTDHRDLGNLAILRLLCLGPDLSMSRPDASSLMSTVAAEAVRSRSQTWRDEQRSSLRRR